MVSNQKIAKNKCLWIVQYVNETTGTKNKRVNSGGSRGILSSADHHRPQAEIN
jgi:hypothetical protein